jgi:RNA polymerase sigma-70 factor, ECF subfamily
MYSYPALRCCLPDRMPEDSPNPIPPPTRSLNSDSEAVSPLSASTPDDFALLSRVRSGDQGAMADLFDRYSGVLYSVALRVLKDPGQAEDIMQDIFIQVWRKPDSFASGRGSLGGWLAVVTRNRAIDLLRKRRPSDSVEDVVLASKTNTASEAERNVLMEKVRIVMAELPPDQKTSVELAYFDGMSHTEIAEKTGEPLGTVKTRIRLAMMTLRKALGT